MIDDQHENAANGPAGNKKPEKPKPLGVQPREPNKPGPSNGAIDNAVGGQMAGNVKPVPATTGPKSILGQIAIDIVDKTGDLLTELVKTGVMEAEKKHEQEQQQ